jgi:hypothetical protein
MREAQAAPQSCALGSVKSMIGHTKCAAGIAGLIKTTLALHHRVLPPTLVETPNPKGDFEGGVLYLNTEPKPWVHGALHPRYAGISAFGFGGVRLPRVLSGTPAISRQEPTNSRCFRRSCWSGRVRIGSRCAPAVERCLESLGRGPSRPCRSPRGDLEAMRRARIRPILTVVAASLDDLREAPGRLGGSGPADLWHDPRGLDFAERPRDPGRPGGVPVPWPGGPSIEYAQVARRFPEVRRVLDRAEAILAGSLERPLGRFLYPGSTFRPEMERANQEAITRADVA